MSAPGEPKETVGFKKLFFTSCLSLGRCAVHVINNQSSQNQKVAG